MIKELLKVGLFMRAFGQRVEISPVTEISPNIMGLRKKLSLEELEEFENSFTYYPPNCSLIMDRAQALDALADRLYVLLGDAHAVGLGLYLPVAFRMVHESNMTKLWTVEEVDRIKNTPGYIIQAKKTGSERCYVVTNPLGKILKSPSYKPVDFYSLIDELDGQEVLDFDTPMVHVYGGDEDETPDPDEVFETVDEVEEDNSNA